MKNILLIEDDLVLRENTAEILELAGYKILSASDGKEGVEKAVELKPDLIVSDIMMPGLNGYEVLKILSRNVETYHIPFIFLTAKIEKTEIRKGMMLGATDYLTKPFDELELLEAVELRIKNNEKIKDHHFRDKNSFSEFILKAKDMNGLEGISNNYPTRKIKKKSIIYSQGDHPESLFYICSGKVKTVQINDDGKELIDDVFVTGDFLGYSAIFRDMSYQKTSVAIENCEICIIPLNEFKQMMKSNRDISSFLISRMSKRINEKEQQLISLAYDSVRKRTADALLSLEAKFDQDKNGRSFIRVTREDLASMVGTATETVIRCLSEFKDQGIIQVEGRSILILNHSALGSLE